MWGLMVAGLLFFPGIFLLSSRSLRILMGWSQADAVIVSARSVSSVQAVMAVAAGCVIASACRSDLLHDRHWLTDTYITFAAPYFVYDVYAMFLCDWHRRRVKGHEADGGARQAAILGYVRREYLMVLHHIFMVVFCLPASLVWRQGKGDYFQGVLFLAELSTPFVCLAKVLIQLKRADTLAFKVNGALTLLVFFGCRVALFPYLYLAYSRYASIPVHQAVLGAPWPCTLGAGLLWPLQIYWFWLMCQRAWRILAASKTPP
ncbi:ceramide synthase-like isoform X1 [Syngnathus scovelli]|uniref:ceramide synthase-like isoform X1 n=1 Tax=Syngnathus scovelli TaxID=161590 RepID=UPI00210F9BDF|nr:ceramide synthase-like isoform X1 [Syngnathus scovelli]XP_049600520.1 ceramide synthase-like isoform X1 [Syngnathus scovelli]